MPLGGVNLILPNAAVVEILTFGEIDPVKSNQPDWLLGSFFWRNKSVPLVSFPRLLGREVLISDERRRIAVCHSFSSKADIPFFGIEAQGLPQLVNLNEETLEIITADEAQEKLPVVAMVQVNDDLAYIPDIEAIGKMLDDLV